MNPTRGLAALRKQLTPLMTVTILLIGAASLAAAVQFFLLDLPAAALAAVLAGAGVALLAWKIQVTSLTGKTLERQLKLLAAARTAAAAPHPPITAAPVVPTAPVTAPAPPERSLEDKLRVVGTYTPPPNVQTTGGPGRLAAGVAADPDAPFRLFAATHGFGAPPASLTSSRAIALIGSGHLAETLGAHGSVYRLHPSLTAAELEHARPSALVVEEDALNSGPWCGALDPHGAKLLLEIRVAMAWMRRHTGAIYVVTSTGRAAVSAAAMRADTILIDDDFTLRQADGGPASLATVLAAHRGKEGVA